MLLSPKCRRPKFTKRKIKVLITKEKIIKSFNTSKLTHTRIQASDLQKKKKVSKKILVEEKK